MLLKCKAYIRGAYGPGNIGDDVLMLSVIKLLEMRYDARDIYVGVEHPKEARALHPAVNWIHIKKPVQAELVVLGGGGQFFSFVPPSEGKRNFKSSLVGGLKKFRRQSGLVDTMLRMYVGKRGGVDRIYLHKRLAAFCIGLGPFDGGGYGEWRAKEFLRRCDYISVRDQVSSRYCEEYGRSNVSTFIDPTLLRALWVEDGTTARVGDVQSSENKYLTFVLRDWPHDARGQLVTQAIVSCAERFRREGRKVRFCAVYKSRDAHLIEKYSDFPWVVWDPCEGISPAEFVRRLILSSSSIISSRAHGVLLPAVLGEPTLAVAIEEKLKQVHKMLPKGTLLVDEASPDAIYEKVLELEVNKEALRSVLIDEVLDGSKIVENAVKDFLAWLDKSKFD
jgi:polysaccharide pyruvyl transferase WcaK-like protein